MMPLMLAQIGEENIIRKIGGSPEIKQHLENLGFVVGGTVTDGQRSGRKRHQSTSRSRASRISEGDGEKNHDMTALLRGSYGAAPVGCGTSETNIEKGGYG